LPIPPADAAVRMVIPADEFCDGHRRRLDRDARPCAFQSRDLPQRNRTELPLLLHRKGPV